MKILLIAVNAKYIHSNLAVHSLKAYAEQRLSGLLQVGLSQADSLAPEQQLTGTFAEIEIAEYTINQLEDFILADIYKRKPDVAAFSCYIWNIAMVRHIVGDLSRLRPEMPIWLGGPEVSFELEDTIKSIPGTFGLMIGEGEKTFAALAERYAATSADRAAGGGEGGAGADCMISAAGNPSLEAAARLKSVDLSGIPGLFYRDGAGFKYQPPALEMDLSAAPFVYESMPDWENKIIYYETSRGCPFSCSYCLSSVDKHLRFRELELVKQELQRFLDAKVPQVKFVDRTFNCRKSHAMAIWHYIHEHDNGVTNFHFEIGADLIDEEELELMRQLRPGLIQLETGVQSTNEKTLREINRYAEFEKIADVTRRVKGFGNIHQHLDLIAGLPYEDYESFGHSFDDVYSLRPDQLQLGFLKVLKGSVMFDRAAEYGLVYRTEAPYEVLKTNWLSFEDVIRLKGIEEMVEQYYNSCQFANTLDYLMRYVQRPFTFFERLASFYERENASARSMNRMARYEFLYEFIRREIPQALCGARALLVWDLYLREPAKSRPAFAPDQDAFKELVSDAAHEAWKEEVWKEEMQAGAQLSFRKFMYLTHTEVFSVDMEKLICEGIVEEKADLWLFDYRKRNPLSGDAKRKHLPGL